MLEKWRKYIECFKKESMVSFAKCNIQTLGDKDEEGSIAFGL